MSFKPSSFYVLFLLALVFEVLHQYLIMPFPGSQQTSWVQTAHFLYSWRWLIRGLLWSGMFLFFSRFIAGASAFHYLSWLVLAGVFYVFNCKMTAERMFLQPERVVFSRASEDNQVDSARLVLGVVFQGRARAYPVQYLAYHHYISDQFEDSSLLLTYCTVCRTGRVYLPYDQDQFLRFRLVGMDRFNAMIEDHASKSWWQQATGEAVAGPAKGRSLPEYPFFQGSLSEWLKLHPESQILQPDCSAEAKYAKLSGFEAGLGKSHLTRSDTSAWKDKSWIVGISWNGMSKAYDWKDLKEYGCINDTLGPASLLIALASDGKSFAAFLRSDRDSFFIKGNDTISNGTMHYTFAGNCIPDDQSKPCTDLIPVQAYQEFWHSWRTFHPNSGQYRAAAAPWSKGSGVAE